MKGFEWLLQMHWFGNGGTSMIDRSYRDIKIQNIVGANHQNVPGRFPSSQIGSAFCAVGNE